MDSFYRLLLYFPIINMPVLGIIILMKVSLCKSICEINSNHICIYFITNAILQSIMQLLIFLQVINLHQLFHDIVIFSMLHFTKHVCLVINFSFTDQIILQQVFFYNKKFYSFRFYYFKSFKLQQKFLSQNDFTIIINNKLYL